MYIVPITSFITPLEPMQKMAITKAQQPSEGENAKEPTFLDAMMALWNNAEEAQAVKSQDMMNLMLGDTDNLEQMQMNIAKAEIATELFVNVKNAAVEAYNQIMQMSV